MLSLKGSNSITAVNIAKTKGRTIIRSYAEGTGPPNFHSCGTPEVQVPSHRGRIRVGLV